MLKVAFPVAIRGTRATYEVQFGAYERPTHRNTSWEQQKFEVPLQRWLDLSEAGYGVSLLNDAATGDVKGNVLRLTLLRGTTSPIPRRTAANMLSPKPAPARGSWWKPDPPPRLGVECPRPRPAGRLPPAGRPACSSFHHPRPASPSSWKRSNPPKTATGSFFVSTTPRRPRPGHRHPGLPAIARHCLQSGRGGGRRSACGWEQLQLCHCAVSDTDVQAGDLRFRM